MSRQERYFIGPNLLTDIRRVVGRVDGIAYNESGPVQGVAHQSLHQPDYASARGIVRSAEFTGQWNINTEKGIQFAGDTNTNNTVSATNLLMPLEAIQGATAECMIVREGASWKLMSVNMTKLKSYSVTAVQVLGHNAEGYMEWYSVTSCSATASP